MLGILVYICFLAATALAFWYKKWYKLDHSSLLSQGMFWGAMAVPTISFFYFGGFAWQGYVPSLDADGLNEFISISKLPIGLLSLSIPLVAITASVHRSIQTQEQILSALNQVSLAKKKNSLDEYYVREKNFLDKCSFVEKRVGKLPTSGSSGRVEHVISLSAPHRRFNAIYTGSHPDRVSLYKPSEMLFYQISSEVDNININLQGHMSRFENNDIPSNEDGAVIVYVVMRALCKTFDLLHVDLFPVPYFLIKTSGNMIQVSVSSEADLKYWLRKYIILVESFVGSVWPENKCHLLDIRKYVFLGANFFSCFDEGSITHEYYSINWGDTTNIFKCS